MTSQWPCAETRQTRQSPRATQTKGTDVLNCPPRVSICDQDPKWIFGRQSRTNQDDEYAFCGERASQFRGPFPFLTADPNLRSGRLARSSFLKVLVAEWVFVVGQEVSRPPEGSKIPQFSQFVAAMPNLVTDWRTGDTHSLDDPRHPPMHRPTPLQGSSDARPTFLCALRRVVARGTSTTSLTGHGRRLSPG
jgi:hypothetical protein